MFEAHITYDRKHASTIRIVAKVSTSWKFSQIDGDPVLGDKVFCYLSAHSADALALQMQMESVVNIVMQTHDVTPIRTKIEAILFDKRW